MVNLFDIARGGPGLDALSRRLILDPAETRMAVEALLPAFTLALRHAMLDPASFARLAQAVGSGRYAGFYEAPSGPDAQASGDGLLELLFRDPGATRRVAEQAAAASGIGVKILAELLPLLAGMLVGGLSRYATLEGFSGLLKTWSDALGAASRGYEATAARPPAPAGPAADPWSAWLALAAPFGAQPRPVEPVRPPPSPFEAWTAGLLGRPAPPPPPPPPVANPFEALSRMFGTGREVQAQYLDALTSILDGAWGRRRPS